MAQRADPKQTVTFEELLRACVYEQEALRRAKKENRPILLRYAIAHL